MKATGLYSEDANNPARRSHDRAQEELAPMASNLAFTVAMIDEPGPFGNNYRNGSSSWPNGAIAPLRSKAPNRQPRKANDRNEDVGVWRVSGPQSPWCSAHA